MILDTNALSAVADNVPPAVQAFVNAERIALPVIVLGEYLYGISHSRGRTQYENWLAKLIAASHVLCIDEQTAQLYADIRSELRKIGKPIPSNDVWIAALGRQHSLPILSRDLHFDAVAGITRLAW